MDLRWGLGLIWGLSLRKAWGKNGLSLSRQLSIHRKNSVGHLRTLSSGYIPSLYVGKIKCPQKNHLNLYQKP